jgi:Leucine-rich repeat (LRR) protein
MRESAEWIFGALLSGACAIVSNAAFAAIPAEERQALLDLYQSTNGDGWYFRDGWNGPAGTECSWMFVACDDAGAHVTGLDFMTYRLSNGLAGPLPPSLANLTHLEVLSVSNNAIAAPLPDFSALTELQVLDISYTDTFGPLPPLAGLRHLRIFNAARGGFAGPIPSLAGLAELTEFYAWDNQLSGPLPSLEGLASLQVFQVQQNRLSGTIPPLAGLAALVDYSVYENELTGPLPSLAGLANLQSFQVFTNALSGTIPPLTRLPSLLYFDVSSNALTGPLPSLDGLPVLNGFGASDNALEGPLPSLEGLANLASFRVAHNDLTGPLPSLEGMTNLTWIDVSFNRLTGALPPVPNPYLRPAGATLCPNLFDPTPSADWDAATDRTPWYADCLETTVNLDQFGLTGSWYNPTMSGQGILLDSMPDMDAAGGSVLFGGWFTFVGENGINLSPDPARQRWLTLQGSVSAGATEALLGIYATEDGRFVAPPVVSAELIGFARMRFTDCNTATITSRFFTSARAHYSLGFAGGPIDLQRLTGSTTCGHDGDNGADGANSLLSGAWYDPALGGQGVLVDISATQHTFFAAWYTYGRTAGSSPNHRWYTLQAENVRANARSLTRVPIYLTVGGAFQSTDPTATTTDIGWADITFESCSEMTLSYAFSTGENDGTTGTVRLARLSPVPQGCSP